MGINKYPNQKELGVGPLLDLKGDLLESGFSFQMVREYDRTKIKANKTRIKEWDYYYIGNNHHGVAFTIDDNYLYGLGSVSILDFDNKKFITKSSMKFLTKGKVNFPSSSKQGDITWKDKNYYLHFYNKDKRRTIDVKINNYDNDLPFMAHFELEEVMDDSMVIATPFLKPKHFYYNEKKNCMRAKGYYQFGGERVEFSDMDTFAILDWGRGVWTYKNTWYWSGLSGVSNNTLVGFNLGYGFGDTSSATENMLFYDKKAYKLKDVVFNIPKNDKGEYLYLEPRTIKSESGDINLTFIPILDRKDSTNLLILKSIQHQVFGVFNGTIKVDDIEVEIKDTVSFAERVTNYW